MILKHKVSLSENVRHQSVRKKLAEKISCFTNRYINLFKKNKPKPIEDKTVQNLTQYFTPLSPLPPSYGSYPPTPPPPLPLLKIYQLNRPSSPFPLSQRTYQIQTRPSLPSPYSCQSQTCNPPSSTPYPPPSPPPWDKREINDENYPQSQKISLGWCGYSVAYKAIWKQGPITYWDTNTNNWERFGGHEVVLKVIKGSQKNLDEFINELSAHHKFSKKIGHVLRCFGVSRWEDTGDFIVVTSYAKDGNLRQYIRKKVESFSWIERLITLKDIAKGLEIIHNSGKREQLVTIYNSFQDAENERKNSDSIIYIPTIDQTSQLISIK
ncbi:unnamed protein product [Rhizophagus irregularis]|nr:unnamed protein product [Rhizophagus irregularis]